jgi:hypothetical protein
MLAFIGHDGRILIDSRLTTEADVWCTCLGFPTEDEIEREKQLGSCVMQVELRLVDPKFEREGHEGSMN